MRNFERCEKYYNKYGKFFEENKMLGPNAMWLIEILCEKMELKPGMCVLDMGCGMGLTSIFLANDLWIDHTDNYRCFVEMGVDNIVFPIRAEAHELPYVENYFDATISIDAYHYFGADEIYLTNYYSRLVKKGGQFGIVSPGLLREFGNGLPEPMKSHWEPDMYCFHSAKWWHELWQKTGMVDVTYADTIEDGKEIWRTTADYDLHDADSEDYLTLISMTAIKK